jgi:two-component system cell cycle response regulator DivK
MPTILLVEDDQLNCDILARRLSRRGFRVVTAATGEEAYALAREESPGAVLMDVGLPDIDGWEATRRLRADPRTHDLPIIALTGHIMPDEREQALAAGCDDFHGKPVEFARLLEQIGALLQKRVLS